MASGKSTMLKQMRMAYAASLITSQEKEDARDALIVDMMKGLKIGLGEDPIRTLPYPYLEYYDCLDIVGVAYSVKSEIPQLASIDDLTRALENHRGDRRLQDTFQ